MCWVVSYRFAWTPQRHFGPSLWFITPASSLSTQHTTSLQRHTRPTTDTNNRATPSEGNLSRRTGYVLAGEYGGKSVGVLPFLQPRSVCEGRSRLKSGSHSTRPFISSQLTPLLQRDFSTMANSPRSPPPDSLFVSEDDDHYHREQPPQRRQFNGLAFPARAPRFAGDGLDYRRPVMSAGGGSSAGASRNPATVIDLTEEDEVHGTDSHAASETMTAGTTGSSRAQRLPRYGRNIIDMTSEAEEEQAEATSSRPNFTEFLPPPGHRNTRDHQPRISLLRRPQRHNSDTRQTPDTSNMDDIEILDSRPRSRPPQSFSRSHTPAVPAQRSVTPYPTGMDNAIDLTEDDDDLVVLESRARPRGGVNLTSPGVTAGVGTRSTAERGFDIAGMLQTGSRLLQRLGGFANGLEEQAQQQLGFNQHNHHHNHAAAAAGTRQRTNDRPHLRFEPPPQRAIGITIDMDYGITGFDMGFVGGNRPPTPKYEPPEPAAEGFTRSPGEDEVVVCPNCGDELAVGDSEKKQSIWVIKKCGHVSSKIYDIEVTLIIYRSTAAIALRIGPRRRRRAKARLPQIRRCHSAGALSTAAKSRPRASRWCASFSAARRAQERRVAVLSKEQKIRTQASRELETGCGRGHAWSVISSRDGSMARIQPALTIEHDSKSNHNSRRSFYFTSKHRHTSLRQYLINAGIAGRGSARF